MLLPANLPLEEATEYHAGYDDTIVRKEARYSYVMPMGGFVDYVLGMCPVRKSESMWLLDDRGRFWTSRSWLDGGEIAECWEGQKTLSELWPIPKNSNEFSLIIPFLNQRAARWGEEGRSLAMADFEGTYVGLWDDMSNADRRAVRALTIYSFDQEWGRGAFSRSILAARLKHRRTVTRTKRKEAA